VEGDDWIGAEGADARGAVETGDGEGEEREQHGHRGAEEPEEAGAEAGADEKVEQGTGPSDELEDFEGVADRAGMRAPAAEK
jgi:hypothetical protein